MEPLVGDTSPNSGWGILLAQKRKRGKSPMPKGASTLTATTGANYGISVRDGSSGAANACDRQQLLAILFVGEPLMDAS